MGLWKSVFGGSHEEVWRRVAGMLPGRFETGGLLESPKVHAEVAGFAIVLDIETVSTDQGSFEYTRLRAPFINGDRLLPSLRTLAPLMPLISAGPTTLTGLDRRPRPRRAVGRRRHARIVERVGAASQRPVTRRPFSPFGRGVASVGRAGPSTRPRSSGAC